MKAIALWVAQGFGAGRIPIAPGTFGTVIGLGWFALLLSVRSGWCFLGGTLAGIIASVYLCGFAERCVGEKDPSSVVLDEIVAVPVCFAGWILLSAKRSGSWPQFGDFFGPQTWLMSLGVLVAFRVFDIMKPWPIRQSQTLPGGWGITLDDLLAALYVNGCALLAFIWLA